MSPYMLPASWLTILVIVSFICIAISGGVGYMMGSILGNKNKVVQTVELMNSVLTTWSDFAGREGIIGQPIGVEFENADVNFLRPDQAVLVLKNGVLETKFRVVAERQLVLGRRVSMTYTFQLVAE